MHNKQLNFVISSRIKHYRILYVVFNFASAAADYGVAAEVVVPVACDVAASVASVVVASDNNNGGDDDEGDDDDSGGRGGGGDDIDVFLKSGIFELFLHCIS